MGATMGVWWVYHERPSQQPARHVVQAGGAWVTNFKVRAIDNPVDTPERTCYTYGKTEDATKPIAQSGVNRMQWVS